MRLFGADWPEPQLSELTARLDVSSTALRMAIIDTLVRRAPDLLKPRLAELLTAADPMIRSQAIRVLIRVDKDEAIEQLRALLLSPERALRLAGLQNCLYLPFPEIQDLMIAYLAAETDSELIERAGLLFAINPDPRLPFHLYELASTATGTKSHSLRQVFEIACQLLKDSNILGDRFQAYEVKLQNWIAMKAAHRFVQQCLDQLPAPPETW